MVYFYVYLTFTLFSLLIPLLTVMKNDDRTSVIHNIAVKMSVSRDLFQVKWCAHNPYHNLLVPVSLLLASADKSGRVIVWEVRYHIPIRFGRQKRTNLLQFYLVVFYLVLFYVVLDVDIVL